MLVIASHCKNNKKIHRWRDERPPEGPRFAGESLDADTRSQNGGLRLTPRFAAFTF